MSLNDIYAALRQTHPADLSIIRHYIAWVSFRRHMHALFYFRAHWVTKRTQPKYHWINSETQ